MDTPKESEETEMNSSCEKQQANIDMQNLENTLYENKRFMTLKTYVKYKIL